MFLNLPVKDEGIVWSSNDGGSFQRRPGSNGCVADSGRSAASSARMKSQIAATAVAKLAAAAMLFGTVARHSYDYFTLLRWVVCGVSVFAAARASDTEQKGWFWAFTVIAILFNPVIPVHLKRDTWIFIDFTVAVFMLVSIPFTDRLRPPQ